MNSKQLYYLLVASVVLLGAAIVASPILANSVLVKAATQLSAAKAENDVQQSLLQTNRQNKADLAKYKDLNDIAKAVVPQDKDQAQAVREILKMASDSGMPPLASITFPASTLGGVSTVAGKTNLSQLTPVKGISGVYILPITLVQDTTNPVSYAQFHTFLQKLEQNRRTAQVSSISIQPKKDNPALISFTLVVNEYIKP